MQTLLVAFSRRMCCSRVCSVSTKQRLPRRSTVWPTMRPGMRRTSFSRQAMMPRYGPPYCIGVPSVCPSATAMSAPQSPGRFKQAQADRIERGDDQRAGVVGDLGERLGVFDAAEEVRLLDDDAGRRVVDRGGQVLRRRARRSGVPTRDQLRRRGSRGRWRSSGDTRDARSPATTTLP